MTREDIIRMAREAGFHAWYTQPEEHPEHVAIIERFAALVAAAAKAEEREACAELVENFAIDMDDEWVCAKAAEAIRARGQA